MLGAAAQAAPVDMETARAAFRQAQTQAQHFDAARQVAAINVAQNRLLGAQFWLRRAANYAPDRVAADQNRADFQQVRAQSAIRPSLSFDVRPSNNINNGVEDRIFALGNILLVFPTSALALSGVEYTLAADVSVRLSQSAQQRTEIDLSVFGRTYALSRGSQRLAPSVRGSDYALAQLAFGLTHARQLFPSLGPTELRLSGGKVWYAREPLRRFQRVDLAQTVTLPGGRLARGTLFFERQTPLQRGQPEADLTGLRALYRQPFDAGALSLSLTAQRYDADIATYAWQSRQLRVDFGFAQPLGPLGVSLHAELSDKRYDDFSLSLNGRGDDTAEIGLSLLLNEVSAFGFSPSLTVSAYRTQSNVDRFDTEGVSASFGFRSRF